MVVALLNQGRRFTIYDLRLSNSFLRDELDEVADAARVTPLVVVPASCIFDAPFTMSNGKTVKILGWYDNEWGYSNRTVDLVQYMGEKL